MTAPDFEAGCSCGWRGASGDADDHLCSLPTLEPCPFDLRDPEHSTALDWLHRYAALMADPAQGTIYSQEHPKLGPLLNRRLDMIRELERYVRDAGQEIVDEARAAGMTWDQIGRELGTTRQAAQQRFGGKP